jgi:hypothetical protein
VGLGCSFFPNQLLIIHYLGKNEGERIIQLEYLRMNEEGEGLCGSGGSAQVGDTNRYIDER